MAKIKELKQGPLGSINTSTGEIIIYPVTTSAAVYHATVAGGSENQLDNYLRTEATKVANNTSDVNALKTSVGYSTDSSSTNTVWGKINGLNSTVGDVWNAINGDWGIRDAIGRNWFDASKGHTNPKKSITDVIGTTSDTASNNTIWGNINRLSGDVSSLSFETELLASNLRDVEGALPNKASVLSVNDIVTKNLGENPNPPTPSPHGLKYRTAWDTIKDLDELIGTQPENTDLSLWESIGERTDESTYADTHLSLWSTVGDYFDNAEDDNDPKDTLWGNIRAIYNTKADQGQIDTAVNSVGEALLIRIETLEEALMAIVNRL